MELQSSNPTLNERTFGAARVGIGEPAMTIQGTVNKTFILLAILVSAAMWTWSQTSNPANTGFLGITFIASMIAGLVFAVATSLSQNGPRSQLLYMLFVKVCFWVSFQRILKSNIPVLSCKQLV